LVALFIAQAIKRVNELIHFTQTFKSVSYSSILKLKPEVARNRLIIHKFDAFSMT